VADRQTRDRVALLLRRAGFGASPQELDRYVGLGFDGALDELLHPERVPEDFDGLLADLSGHLIDLQNIEDVQTWWLYRMARTRRPLAEKVTLFWHGHFAVSNAKVANPEAMHNHLATLRDLAMGNYRELLLAVSRDPAMLLWLDGNTNRKNAPNENYGRELLELYTLGIGNYTEDDVTAAARAFTGWNLREREFFFDKNQHDSGPKTFMGRTGPLDGGDIVDAVVGHPATAERICRKLFAFFAYPNPEPSVLGPLVAAYMDSKYDIRTVLRTLFMSPAFVSDESRYGHIKSPVEFSIGAIRMLGGQARERGLIPILRQMGQDVLNPPNVAGWAGGKAWINPSTLLERFNLAARIASARGETNDGGLIEPRKILGDDVRIEDGATVVRRLADVLDLQLSPEARAGLEAYVSQPLIYPPHVPAAPNPQQVAHATDARLRGVIHLALASTDFQIG